MTGVPKIWADQPFKLIPTPKLKLNGKPQSDANKFATEMAHVHNTIIRALNAIVLQARNIKDPKDIADFIIFCDAMCFSIHEHHTTEETLMFPLIEQHTEKGYMDRNVVQHDAFHPGLHALSTYTKQVKYGVADYDGAKIVKIIEDFGPVLTEHLEQEIESLCGLDKYEVNWGGMNKRVSEHAVNTAEHYMEIPLILCNMDVTFEKGIHKETWPPMPWFACVMFRWLYFPKYKGAWRFGSCDQYGVPQELPFASK